LIEAASGAHIWADRFEGGLEDIFELQDQVTSRVVSAISPALEQVEFERSRRKPTKDLQAYDYYLRGMSCLYKSKERNDEALDHFHKAMNLDPHFARSFAEAAFCYAQQRGYGPNIDRTRERSEAERLARRALELDRKDPTVLALAGWVLAYEVGRIEDGAALLDSAIELDPNLFFGWHYRGWTSSFLGERKAIEFHERALRLSPLDPKAFLAHSGIAFAHFLAGSYDEASSWAATALRQRPNHLASLVVAMASHALAGRIEEARAMSEVCRQAYPSICISSIRHLIPLRIDVDLVKFVKGFRLAGMPE
jgi:tetratricopeptide (TPR) repeat protein